MGASYSTTIPGATERQRERYGVFSLRTKQNQTLSVLEDLIVELMSESSLISLRSLFKEGKMGIDCTDMFVVLSSTLKKEFQVFKFPDPIRPSVISDIAYLPKSVYDKRFKEDENRGKLCNQIAWFMVRFTTLVFALAASLKVPRSMTLDMPKSHLFIPTIGQSELQFDIKLINGHGFLSSHPTLGYIQNENVLIDTRQSIVFLNGAPETGVARITIEPRKIRRGTGSVDQTAQAAQLLARALMQAGTQPVQTGAQTAPGALPPASAQNEMIISPNEYVVTLFSCSSKTNTCAMRPSFAIQEGEAGTVGLQRNALVGIGAGAGAVPVPVAAATQPFGAGGAEFRPSAGSVVSNGSGLGLGIPGSSASVTTAPGGQEGGRRSTRKRRMQKRRKTYRYIGGGFNSELGLPAGSTQFILNKDGLTYSSSDPSRIPFNDRVAKYLESMSDKFKPLDNPYYPIDNTNATVINRLMVISDILKAPRTETNKEGTSPAQYRAYILATQTDQTQKKLGTTFCKDVWSNKQATSVLPYALLDALYKDIPENKSTTETEMEYVKVTDQFVINNMMKPIESSAKTFNDLTFTSVQDELTELCKRTEFSISDPQTIELLMNAHKSLRDLYDSHMQTVIQFITSKIITPKLRGYRATPEWVLNPAFSTDERGAMVVLESIIREARIMLIKHYFAVESIYVSTIQKIKSASLGLESAATTSAERAVKTVLE